jgi:hypothetical protein
VVHVPFAGERVHLEVVGVGEVRGCVDEVAVRGEVVAAAVPKAVADFVDVAGRLGKLWGRVVAARCGCG